jgi:NAD(P)-dependent dehydrogenase (short-subunit alcohol dehydrogenase family)
MSSEQTLRVFHNATAIITGGASGIGRALAEELARRDCEVVLADLQIELAQEVASKIQDSGGKAEAMKVDVVDFPAVEKLVQTTVKRTGRLDYMFNNAGIAVAGSVDLYGIEDWNYVVDVNLRGVINGVQAAYKRMIAQGFGHIVNTASMAGLMPGPGNVSYTMAKHGIVGLSTSLRAEAAHLGVRVSVICPGVIRTPILEGGKYCRTLIELPLEKVRDMWERLKPMPSDIFAQKVINAVAKNKAIIIFPSWWRRIWWINRIAPTLGIALGQKHYHAILKEFEGKLK